MQPHPQRKKREHPHERQPLLPFDAVTQEMNRRDAARETRRPEQLSLLEERQRDLFSS